MAKKTKELVRTIKVSYAQAPDHVKKKVREAAYGFHRLRSWYIHEYWNNLPENILREGALAVNYRKPIKDGVIPHNMSATSLSVISIKAAESIEFTQRSYKTLPAQVEEKRSRVQYRLYSQEKKIAKKEIEGKLITAFDKKTLRRLRGQDAKLVSELKKHARHEEKGYFPRPSCPDNHVLTSRHKSSSELLPGTGDADAILRLKVQTKEHHVDVPFNFHFHLKRKAVELHKAKHGDASHLRRKNWKNITKDQWFILIQQLLRENPAFTFDTKRELISIPFRCPVVPPVESPEEYAAFLGIDIGIKKFLCVSDGTLRKNGTKLQRGFFGDEIEEKIKMVTHKMDSRGKIRNRLLNGVWVYSRHETRAREDVQKRKRRSLQELKGREEIKNLSKYYAKQVCLAIDQLYPNQRVAVAIENLKWIKSGDGKAWSSRKFNKTLACWQIVQFQETLESNLILRGHGIIKVSPRYTSQTCPECGNVDEKNRVTQELFRCRECGFSDNADYVGAVNIARRGKEYLLSPKKYKANE